MPYARGLHTPTNARNALRTWFVYSYKCKGCPTHVRRAATIDSIWRSTHLYGTAISTQGLWGHRPLAACGDRAAAARADPTQGMCLHRPLAACGRSVVAIRYGMLRAWRLVETSHGGTGRPYPRSVSSQTFSSLWKIGSRHPVWNATGMAARGDRATAARADPTQGLCLHRPLAACGRSVVAIRYGMLRAWRLVKTSRGGTGRPYPRSVSSQTFSSLWKIGSRHPVWNATGMAACEDQPRRHGPTLPKACVFTDL